MVGAGLPGAPHSLLGSHRHFSSCRYWLNLAENKQSVNRILTDTINSCRFLQPKAGWCEGVASTEMGNMWSLPLAVSRSLWTTDKECILKLKVTKVKQE